MISLTSHDCPRFWRTRPPKKWPAEKRNHFLSSSVGFPVARCWSISPAGLWAWISPTRTQQCLGAGRGLRSERSCRSVRGVFGEPRSVCGGVLKSSWWTVHAASQRKTVQAASTCSDNSLRALSLMWRGVRKKDGRSPEGPPKQKHVETSTEPDAQAWLCGRSGPSPSYRNWTSWTPG